MKIRATDCHFLAIETNTAHTRSVDNTRHDTISSGETTETSVKYRGKAPQIRYAPIPYAIPRRVSFTAPVYRGVGCAGVAENTQKAGQSDPGPTRLLALLYLALDDREDVA